MATTIAKLNVNLTANAVGLVKNLDKGKRAVKGFGSSVDRFTGGIMGKLKVGLASGAAAAGRFAMRIGGMMVKALAAGTAALGAAAVGLAYFTKQQADAIDSNAKMARRLGMTYGELRTFQYAAGLAGVETEVLNKGIEKMLDTLGSAFMGDTMAIEAFEQIGLSLEELQRLNPAKQFEAIGAAISRIENPAQRIAAVRDIFGRAGGSLVELFEGGSAAIRQATQTAEMFGLILSEVDTSNIEYMNDRLSDLRTMMDGIGDQLAAKVSPYISQIADDIISWVDSMGGIESIVETGLGGFGDALDWILDKTNKLTAVWNTFGDIVTGVLEKARAAWEMIPEPVRKVIAFNPIRDFATGSISESYKSNLGEAETGIGDRFRSGVRSFTNRAEAGAEQRQTDNNRSAAWANIEGIVRDEQADRQARMATQAQRHPEWFSTPFAQQSTNSGTMPGGEEISLLRQIAMNTGKPSLAFGG